MDAVTYPHTGVVEFVRQYLVAVKLRFDTQPFAKDFNVKWTPTLIIIDEEGREHNRTVGFLPPEELVPSLLLGMAKACFDTDRFSDTLPLLDKLLAAYPGSSSAPEAVYLRGVTGYKSTHDPKSLKAAYERLLAEYPGSEWVNRASPYQLL